MLNLVAAAATSLGSPSNSTFGAQSLLLACLLVIASSFLLFRCGFSSFGSSQTQNHLPPGSFGFPLIGETLQFALFNSGPIGTPPPFLAARLRRYGSVFKTHILGRPAVVSMDANFNRFLLTDNGKLVRAEFPHAFKKIVGPVLTWIGPPHKMMREIATALLSPATIRERYLDELQDHALWILNSWSEKVKVDAQAEAKRFISIFIVKHITGLDRQNPITFQMLKDIQFLMDGYASVPIDFPGTTFNRLLKARGRIVSVIQGLVRAKRKEGRAGHGEAHGDILDYMLKDTNPSGLHYSEEEIVEVAVSFITAGTETASVLITNLVKYLSENPVHLEELRAEHTRIRMTKAANEKLTWSDYKQMNFTQKVIQEALRVASVVHYVSREALQDIHYGGFTIPKGWMIFLNFAMVHLDPGAYPQPLEFNPSRWEETMNKTANFMPFSGGTRSCIGSSMTKFEAAVFLHYLVTLYRWERITEHGELDRVSALSFPTMRKGLHIQVQPLM